MIEVHSKKALTNIRKMILMHDSLGYRLASYVFFNVKPSPDQAESTLEILAQSVESFYRLGITKKQIDRHICRYPINLEEGQWIV